MTAPTRPARDRARRVLRGIAWLYGLALLGVIAAVYGLGERFWPVTLFLFGPRWIVGLPLALLLPAALILDRRGLLVLLACSGLVAFPLLGLRVHLPAGASAGKPDLRLATWNVGGGGFERAQLDLLLAEANPHIVVLQECGAGEVDLPRPWHTHHDGGMCLLSRIPLVAAESRDRSDVWARAGQGAIVSYELKAPWGRFHLTNVHLETPREGIEEVLGSGLEGVATLEVKNAQRVLEGSLARRWVDRAPAPAVLVAGDFNTPVESDIFRDHWSGLQDCFGKAGLGFGHTKRTRRFGTRIDHVLAGPSWRCLGAWVDRDRGTDHRPLVVDLAWSAGS